MLCKGVVHSAALRHYMLQLCCMLHTTRQTPCHATPHHDRGLRHPCNHSILNLKCWPQGILYRLCMSLKNSRARQATGRQQLCGTSFSLYGWQCLRQGWSSRPRLAVSLCSLLYPCCRLWDGIPFCTQVQSSPPLESQMALPFWSKFGVGEWVGSLWSGCGGLAQIRGLTSPSRQRRSGVLTVSQKRLKKPGSPLAPITATGKTPGRCPVHSPH